MVTIVLVSGCSPPGRDQDPGRLDRWGLVRDGRGRIAAESETLYRWAGQSVEQFDVSNPSQITPLAEAPTATDCFFGFGAFPCSVLVIQGERAYVSVLANISFTELPTGPASSELVDVGHVVVAIPGGLVGGSLGELTFFSRDLDIVSTANIPAADLFSSGPILYATTPESRLVVLDVTSSASVAVIGSADLIDVPGWTPVGEAYQMSTGTAVAGDSFFLLRTLDDSHSPSDYPCRLEWYRMSPAYDAATLLDVVEADIGGCTGITAVEGYVAIALNSFGGGEQSVNLHPRIEVYRTDPADGLVRVFRHRFREYDEFLYDIVADPALGLLFAGTTEAVYTLDLGTATTGEPTWPD